MNMLQFATPWLFLLLPLPWLARRLLPGYREPRPAVRVPFMERLQRITGQAGAGSAPTINRLRLQWALVYLCWIALVFALARPQWLDEPVVQELPMRDLLIALDLSGSMETTDFTDADRAATDRLSAAKQVLGEFLSQRDGDRVGLVFFGTAAFVQAPFTDDLDVVRELLGEAQVRMLGPRTALGDAIGVAINLFERSEVDERVLIVLTDGNDTGSLLPPARAAGIAADEGMTIHTVAMGDPAAVGEQALDEEALAEVARVTGGEYFHANDRAELAGIYETLDELNPRKVDSRSYRPVHEVFYWPLAVAMLASLLLFLVAEFLPTRRRAPGAQS
jgi:Ca-activated chloride channel family protein